MNRLTEYKPRTNNMFPYVLKDDDSVQMRAVKLGDVYDGQQVIVSGLKAGEKVLISGLANRMLRDGVSVNVLNAQELQKAE